jgi:hypothetical protein
MWGLEIIVSLLLVYVILPAVISGLVFWAIWLLNWIIR